MKVLALDTSGLVASVAFADDNVILSEYTTNFKKTHSVTLMPMIQDMCRMLDMDVETIDCIGVSGGPGSFTGLRIGSATAKGLAHAWNIPIASVPTLEVLANNIDHTECLICPMLDARRGQVYSAIYEYKENEIVPLTEMMAIELPPLIALLRDFQKKVIFLGDGVKPNLEKIQELMEDASYIMAAPQNNIQRAATLATLALRYAKAGKVQTYLDHVPIYLRKSQAEREYEEKHNNPLE